MKRLPLATTGGLVFGTLMPARAQEFPAQRPSRTVAVAPPGFTQRRDHDQPPHVLRTSALTTIRTRLTYLSTPRRTQLSTPSCTTSASAIGHSTSTASYAPRS